MPLYRWNTDNLEPVPPTTFETEQLREREDLQRLLRAQPDTLEEGLFIVAEEFGDWEESNRRIDLLALDRKNRLVVIELKRSDWDSLMDLQAIRYAAMVSNMTRKQLIAAHQQYINDPGNTDDAEMRINEHLSDNDGDLHTQYPRIILASSEFSKELTTSVLWLNQSGLSITCVKLQPYRMGDALLVEKSQVIPIPEATEYMVRLRDREKEDEHYQVAISSGGEIFRRSIETAEESQKERLMNLLQLAVSLEAEGLASLETSSGSYNTVLRIRFPDGSGSGLVNVFKNQSGWGYLKFNGPTFDRRAPKSKRRIEKIIGNKISKNTTLWEHRDGFLEALTDAYREANGLPPTSPPPGSGPGSPPTEGH